MMDSLSGSSEESDDIADTRSLTKKKTPTRPPPSAHLQANRSLRAADRKESAELDDQVMEGRYFDRLPRKMAG